MIVFVEAFVFSMYMEELFEDSVSARLVVEAFTTCESPLGYDLVGRWHWLLSLLILVSRYTNILGPKPLQTLLGLFLLGRWMNQTWKRRRRSSCSSGIADEAISILLLGDRVRHIVRALVLWYWRRICLASSSWFLRSC